MKSFLYFLLDEQNRPTIKGEGMDSARHEKQYVTPYIGSETPTHVVAKPYGSLKPGANIKIHKAERINGALHLHASDEAGNKEVIPASKVEKPGAKPANKGFDYEANVVNNVKKHGLMASDASGAGATSGNDFHLINKKKNIKHKGEVHPEQNVLQGEAKAGKTAAFGQLTIAYDKKKGGWHVPESNEANRPGYTKHVRGIRINGTPLLDHLNQHHSPEGMERGGPKAKDVKVDHPNLEPANSYLNDHHVDVVQVGGHGLYHTGKDKTGVGLPGLSGKGQFRIRQKTSDPYKRTVQFMAKDIAKSHVDLDNEDHVKKIAKALGH